MTDTVTVEVPGGTVEILTVGGQGPVGPPGVGVPPGGATGEVLAKVTGTDYHTGWVTGGGGGGGEPTGVAGGDLTGSYPNPQLAPGAIVDADVSSGAGIAQSKVAGLPAALAALQPTAARGAPGGYCPLDAAAQVPTSHLPPMAVNEVFVVGSEAAMLALVAQVGDMAIRTDNGKTYALAADPPSVLANWKEVIAAGQVVSVNGQTGVVSLTAAQVGAPPTGTQIVAGAGLTGGGTLAADRTLAVVGDATLNVAPDLVSVVSAPRWTTPRTLTLTGDVTGSAFVDGTANVSIATTTSPGAAAEVAVEPGTPASNQVLWVDTDEDYAGAVPPGVGLPAGGAAGQSLVKTAAGDYSVGWSTISGGTTELPPGGTTGQALLKISGADYAVGWSTITAGGAALPGLIDIDTMTGATDDAKLTAAISLAQSHPGTKPAIAFGARRYDFNQAGRVVYSGLKLVGLAGQGSQQRAANSTPNDIRYNGSGVWWVVPSGDTFDVCMQGLSFQGNANAQFMSANPGVLWTSVFRDLGFNLWKHVWGNPTAKFLNTACKWLGYFNINNSYSTAGTFGGSDSEFFLDGGLIDSPPTFMPAGDYHLIFSFQEKSGVGPIFNTAERASGILIDGGSTHTGLVFCGQGRVEGRNGNQPTHGSNIRVNGGGVTIRDWWVAYGGTALNTNGHTGEGGIITQTGGDVLYDALWYDRAVGVAETVPFIFVSGGKARVRNIRTGAKGGSWVGLPRVRAAGGTLDADNSVTVI